MAACSRGDGVCRSSSSDLGGTELLALSCVLPLDRDILRVVTVGVVILNKRLFAERFCYLNAWVVLARLGERDDFLKVLCVLFAVSFGSDPQNPHQNVRIK